MIDSAKVPRLPYKPHLWLNALIGLILGIFFGVAYVVMTEKADRMLQEPSDISFYLGVPELGVIPSERSLRPSSRNFLQTSSSSHGDGKQLVRPKPGGELPRSLELVTWQDKPSLMAESFRAALTSVLFTGQNGDRPRILVVTSQILAMAKPP